MTLFVVLSVKKTRTVEVAITLLNVRVMGDSGRALAPDGVRAISSGCASAVKVRRWSAMANSVPDTVYFPLETTSSYFVL
ncbi:MAG: hypothetical protein BWY02_02055 [bacterium ADurb.Bin157]|nr:MAG: hypothetical protein BWY02_02055 [bacterium ADurb.Bin157]